MNAKFAEILANIDFDTIEGDLGLIDGAVEFVGRHRDELNAGLGKLNAVEKWVAIGQHFRKLHEHLIKNENKPKRIGWVKAFKEREKYGLQYDRRTAEMLMAVADFFGGGSTATTPLPVGWFALYRLATIFKGKKDLLAKCVQEKRITPLMTREEIKKLGKELGLIAVKLKPKREKLPIKIKTIRNLESAVIKKMQACGADAQDKKNFLRNCLEEWKLKPEDL